jgi:hypothetical protein
MQNAVANSAMFSMFATLGFARVFRIGFVFGDQKRQMRKSPEMRFGFSHDFSAIGSRAYGIPLHWGKGGGRVRLSSPFKWDPIFGKGTLSCQMGPDLADDGTLDLDWVPICGAGSRTAQGCFRVGYLGTMAFTNSVGLRHWFPAYRDRSGRRVCRGCWVRL